MNATAPIQHKHHPFVVLSLKCVINCQLDWYPYIKITGTNNVRELLSRLVKKNDVTVLVSS